MELKLLTLIRFMNRSMLLIVLNGIEIYFALSQWAFPTKLLIVLNGFEIFIAAS